MRAFYCLLALLASLPAAAQKLEEAPPPRASGEVSLQINIAADEAQQRCVGMIAAGQDLLARVCLERVIESAPDSSAALRARASLGALQAARAARQSSGLAAPPPAFPPGRLELVLAAGAFGIWNGTAPAMFLGAQAEIPGFFSAAGGGGAVLLGGTFALGAWLMSEAFDPSPGTSRLLASGMAWGVGLGVALSPWVFTLAGSPWEDGSVLPPPDFERGFPAAAAASAVTGYVGLAVAGGLALAFDFDEAQVSTMNTGAAVGLIAGLALTPVADSFQLANAGVLGLLYAATGALGLLGGFGMGRMVDLEIWEILVVDLITAATAAATGAGAFVLAGTSTGPEGGLLGSAAVIFGTGAALLTSTAALGWLRVQRGERFSRVGFIPIDLIFGAPEVVLDKSGQMTPVLPVVAGRF